MATILDAARADATHGCAATTYQKGNAQENAPTWDIGYTVSDAALAETHIPSAGPGVAGVGNEADAWLPVYGYGGFWLDSTPATERFA